MIIVSIAIASGVLVYIGEYLYRYYKIKFTHPVTKAPYETFPGVPELELSQDSLGRWFAIPKNGG